ncbi:MAG: hypothetical protein ABIJ96_00230 [Elusimicrobiota bacterium]
MDNKISHKPQLMRDEEKKGGGFIASLMAKLGLGGTAAGGAAIGGAGVGAGISSSGAAATGIGLLLSKTGIVALLTMGTAAAVGINALRSPSVSMPKAGGSVFRTQDAASAGDSMASTGAAGAAGEEGDAAAGGVSNSLDYFNKANQGAVQDPTKLGEEGVAVADAPAEDAEEVSSGVEAPDNSNSKGGAAGATRPQMIKATKSFKGKSEKSTNVTLLAQAGAAGGIGGGFDKTYKKTAAMSTGNRSARGARQAQSISRGRGTSAINQAKAVRKSNRNALLGKNLSSASAGLPYDSAGAPSGSIGGPAGVSNAGVGTGGAGVGDARFKPNRSLDTRELPEPKKVEKTKNSTPYQETMQHAMLAVMAAGALLMIAGMIRKQNDPKLTPLVQLFAGLAIAAAGLAVMKGMELMNAWGQNMQGMMFMGMGGIIMIQAAMILMKPESAEAAQAGVDAKSAAAKTATEQSLKGASTTVTPEVTPAKVINNPTNP